MSSAIANNTLCAQMQSQQHTDAPIVDKLPITICGTEKYATGLTKRTTVDDVKFAMLSVSDPSFTADMLDDFGIFERWQGNERLLDGKIKIYKLIRLWQSLPGDQLSQVKFMIKKKKPSFQQHHAPAPQQPQTQKPAMPTAQKPHKLAFRDTNIMETKPAHLHKSKINLDEQSAALQSKASSSRYAFCTLSPAMQKTWSTEKAKRRNSYVQKQLQLAATQQQLQQQQQQLQIDADESSSIVSTTSFSDDQSALTSTNSSDVDDCPADYSKKYAAIKSVSRSKKSTIKRTEQIKKSFVELVHRQNEIIDRQMNKLAEIEALDQQQQRDAAKIGCLPSLNPKHINKYLRSRSLDKHASAGSDSTTKSSATAKHVSLKQTTTRDSSAKSASRQSETTDASAATSPVTEADIAVAFGANVELNEFETKEYAKLCQDYFRVEHCLDSKTRKIEQLKSELVEMEAYSKCGATAKLSASLLKANKKLQLSVEAGKLQKEKINDMNGAINRIDDIIALKANFIQSLEHELQRLESSEPSAIESAQQQQQPSAKKSLAFTSTSASSSTSSTSSVFTSISSISASHASNYNFAQQSGSSPCNQLTQQKLMMLNNNSKLHFNAYTSVVGDNESDTGISSANSDDCNTQLETLV